MGVAVTSGVKRNNHYQPKIPTEYTMPNSIYVATFYAVRHTYNCLMTGDYAGQQMKKGQSFGSRGSLSDLRYLTVYSLRYILDDLDDDTLPAEQCNYVDPVEKKDVTSMMAVNKANRDSLIKACEDAFQATMLSNEDIDNLKDHVRGKVYKDFSVYQENVLRKAWPICIFHAAMNLGYVKEDVPNVYELSVTPFVAACENARSALPAEMVDCVITFIRTCEVDEETGQLFRTDEYDKIGLTSFSKIYLWNVAKNLGFI